jgi:hypothetical protein
MAEIYKICSGATAIDYSITLSGPTPGSCDYNCSIWNEGGYERERCTSTYRITSDKVIPNSTILYVNINNDLHICEYSVPHTCLNQRDITEYLTIEILEGTTYTDFDIYCYDDTHEPMEGPGTLYERDNVLVSAQTDIPTCVPPAPGCLLYMNSIIATDPSERGLSDGSIFASVTGQTGTTIEWRINGIIDTGTLTGHTFTGLTQGSYIIKATEADCWDQETMYVGAGEFKTGDFVVVSPTTNIAAVENPILLNLSTAINSASPVYSVNTFNITGAISNVSIGFALTFPYTYNAEFYSKGYPDRSNYFLESLLKDEVGNIVGNNSAEEIATSLAEVFQKDPIISRLYYISSSGSSVTLIAKEYGSEYDLTSGTIIGSNISLTNTVSGIAQYDGQLTANYSLYSELFVNNSLQYGDTPIVNNYKRVIELELPFNKTNLHQFDFSSTLKNFVNSPKISFTFTGVTFLGGMISSYFLKYGEKYPLIANSNTKKKRYKGQTGYGWSINSSLPFESDNIMDIYFGNTGITGQNNVLFFNTAPNTKYSHRSAKEFMSIIVSKNYYKPLSVFGNIYNYNGSVSSGIKLFDITTTGSTSNYGGMAVLSVGYNDLGLSSYESISKIRKVDIYIQQYSGGTWNSYSEIKSYLLEIDEQPNNYDVSFLNSLGTYETFTFIGETQESSEITRDSYQKPYPINVKGAAAVGFQYNSTIDTNYTKIFTVNTGIIDEDTYYYLQGLLQSNRIYHYDDIHQNYLNVVNQTAIKSTNTNEYSIQIQFKETISENNVNS